jgi:phosphatidate cytidylyltransferase
MHLKRILTALVFLPLFYALVTWGPAWAFQVFVAAAGLLCCREFHAMLRAMGLRPDALWGVLVYLSVLLAMPWRLGAEAAFAVVVAAPLWQVLTCPCRETQDPEARRRRWLGFAASTVLALWLAIGLGCQLLLRFEGGRGAMPLFAFYLAVMAGDTAAYYCGKAFGRHPLAPHISPRKTWEGAAGHLLGTAGALLAAGHFFLPEMTLLHALGMGVLTSFTGQAGDLAVSLLKRASGIKDSGSILPGHGGLLDRADSMLPAGPVFYAWWRWVTS